MRRQAVLLGEQSLVIGSIEMGLLCQNVISGTTLSLSVTTPPVGETYIFTVRAIGTGNLESGNSVARGAYAYGALIAPATVQLQDKSSDIYVGANNAPAIVLSWSKSADGPNYNPVSGYGIYKNGALVTTVSYNVFKYTIPTYVNG